MIDVPALPSLYSNADVPLYSQLKLWFIEQIRKGAWSENPLPSERYLSEALAISRSTVRQAVSALEREGWVAKKHGKGTFVLPPKVEQPLSRLSGFTENMLQAGLTPSSKVLAKELQEPSDKLSRILALAPSSVVAVILRLRLVGGVALMLERSYLNYGMTPKLLEHDLSDSLYKLLTQVYRLRLSKGEESLEVIKADRSTAKLLGIQAAEPLFYTQRLVCNEQNLPVEYAERYARADKCRFKVVLSGDNADFIVKEG